MPSTTTLIGLLRDFVAAALAVALLFGITITQEQIGGILLLVVTGGALATYVYQTLRQGSGGGT